MRNSILKFIALFIIGSFVMTSCGEDTTEMDPEGSGTMSWKINGVQKSTTNLFTDFRVINFGPASVPSKALELRGNLDNSTEFASILLGDIRDTEGTCIEPDTYYTDFDSPNYCEEIGGSSYCNSAVASYLLNGTLYSNGTEFAYSVVVTECNNRTISGTFSYELRNASTNDIEVAVTEGIFTDVTY